MLRRTHAFIQKRKAVAAPTAAAAATAPSFGVRMRGHGASPNKEKNAAATCSSSIDANAKRLSAVWSSAAGSPGTATLRRGQQAQQQRPISALDAEAPSSRDLINSSGAPKTPSPHLPAVLRAKAMHYRNFLTNSPFTPEQLRRLAGAAAARGWTSPYFATWAQLRRSVGAEVRPTEVPTTVYSGHEQLYPIEALAPFEQERLLAANPPWFPSGTGICRGRSGGWAHIMSHRMEAVLNPDREPRKLYVDGAYVAENRIELCVDENRKHTNNTGSGGGGISKTAGAAPRRREEEDEEENACASAAFSRSAEGYFAGADLTADGVKNTAKKNKRVANSKMKKMGALSAGEADTAPHQSPSSSGGTSATDPASSLLLDENGQPLDWHQVQQRRGAAPPLDFRLSFPLQLYSADQLAVPSRGSPQRGLALTPGGRRLPYPAHDYLLSVGVLRGYASPFWLTAGDMARVGASLDPQRAVIEVESEQKAKKESNSGDALVAETGSAAATLVSAGVVASTMEGLAIPLHCCHPAVRSYLEMLPSAAGHMIDHDMALMASNNLNAFGQLEEGENSAVFSEFAASNDELGEFSYFDAGDTTSDDTFVAASAFSTKSGALHQSRVGQRPHATDLAGLRHAVPHGPTLLFTCAGWERVRFKSLLAAFLAADSRLLQARGSSNGDDNFDDESAHHSREAASSSSKFRYHQQQQQQQIAVPTTCTHWVNIDEVIPLLPEHVRAAIGLPTASAVGRSVCYYEASSAAEARWLVVDESMREPLRWAVFARERGEKGGGGDGSVGEAPESAKPPRPKDSVLVVTQPPVADDDGAVAVPSAAVVDLRAATAQTYWNAECLDRPALCNTSIRPLALRPDGRRFGPQAERVLQRTALRRGFASPVWVTERSAAALGVAVLPSEVSNATVVSEDANAAAGANAVGRYYHLSEMADPVEVLERFPINISANVGAAHCHWLLRHQWAPVGSPRRAKLLDEAFATGGFGAVSPHDGDADGQQNGGKGQKGASKKGGRKKKGEEETSSAAASLNPSSSSPPPTVDAETLKRLLASRLWVDCDEAVLYGWQPREGARAAVLRGVSGYTPSGARAGGSVELVPAIVAMSGDMMSGDEGGGGESGSNSGRGKDKRKRFRRRVLPHSQRRWYNAMQTTDPVKVVGLSTYFGRPQYRT